MHYSSNILKDNICKQSLDQVNEVYQYYLFRLIKMHRVRSLNHNKLKLSAVFLVQLNELFVGESFQISVSFPGSSQYE